MRDCYRGLASIRTRPPQISFPDACAYAYREPGEFFRRGTAQLDGAPSSVSRFPTSLEIMTYQLSADYQRCVEAGTCGPRNHAGMREATSLSQVSASMTPTTTRPG